MNDIAYINNLQIGEKIKDDPDFASFSGYASTQSLNAYSYSMHISSLRNFVEDAKDGRGLYVNHNIRNGKLEAGQTIGGTLYAKKAKIEFSILRDLKDINSDDLIRRVEKGVTKGLSVGHKDAEYKCDICSELMERQYYYIEDKNGHYPGQKYTENGKDIIVTATAHNARLNELSIVGIGADPGAKITNKLKQELSDGKISHEALIFMAEFHNLNHNDFYESLGWNDYDPKEYSIPSKGAPIMADLLTKTNEELVERITDMTDEINTLKADIEGRPTKESVELLEAEMLTLKQTLTDKEAGIEVDKIYIAIGKEAIEDAREKAKTSLREKLHAEGVKSADIIEHPDYIMQCKNYDILTSITELYSAASSNMGIARSLRGVGRKSTVYKSQDTEKPEPKVRRGRNDLI